MNIKLIVAAIVAAGVLLLAMLIVGGVLLFRTMRDADQVFAARIDELFAAIDEERFAETYDTYTASEFRRATSREEYAQLGKLIRAELGAMKSKQRVQFHIRQFNATRMANVSYRAVFEKGKGTIHAQFKKVNGRWLLVGFHVNSPVFQKHLAKETCPHCGEAYSPGARFCPHCGKSLAEEGKPVEASH